MNVLAIWRIILTDPLGGFIFVLDGSFDICRGISKYQVGKVQENIDWDCVKYDPVSYKDLDYNQ